MAARLGHRDTSTTLKIYGHPMPGADTRAAGIVGAAFRRPTDDAAAHPETDREASGVPA